MTFVYVVCVRLFLSRYTTVIFYPLHVRYMSVTCHFAQRFGVLAFSGELTHQRFGVLAF